MPPVAANPVNQTNGQTARNGQDRSLQTCRKYHVITEYGNNKIHHPVGAVIDRPAILRLPHNPSAGWGHPARDLTETAIYRVVCREGS